jgi:recyclin-1
MCWTRCARRGTPRQVTLDRTEYDRRWSPYLMFLTNQMGNATTTQPTQAATFLSSANPDQVKRNVLAGFRDALLLPVTIVPLTVTYGMNAIVTGGTQAVNGLAMLNPQRWTGQSGSDGRGATNGAPAVPIDPVEGVEIEKEKAEELEVATEQDGTKDGGEQMQLLLSLDTVLEFVHADRECLKRIETFQGYPSKYGRKVREAIEEVFIHLLRAVAGRHIVPACNKWVDVFGDISCWNRLTRRRLQGDPANDKLQARRLGRRYKQSAFASVS